MKKSTLLTVLTAAIALLGASASFAQEATVAPEFQNITSTKTRAEVIEELRSAEREGLVVRHEGDMERIAEKTFRSLKTRAQVRAETAEAVRLGLVFFGEGGAPVATPEALEVIRIAGLRALESARAVASK